MLCSLRTKRVHPNGENTTAAELLVFIKTEEFFSAPKATTTAATCGAQ